MGKNKFNAEVKAIIKVEEKIANKINPNTDYQAKVKNNIRHIDHELESGDIEQLINCNKIISANYGYLLEKRGFTPMRECDIREKGYDWNYENLKQIRNILQNELFIEASLSSTCEVAPEYLVEKLLGRG